MSSGVGYTLQILAQKDGDPMVVSLILSLESFFAVVSGAIFLHERMSLREYFGCALMLTAVILSQLPEKSAKAVESDKKSDIINCFNKNVKETDRLSCGSIF